MIEPASGAQRVHVLDTAAVYYLARNHRPPLWRRLVETGQEVFIPAIVLLEAEQAEPIAKKRLEALEEYAQVDGRLPRRLVERASAALREVERERCPKCSGFPRDGRVIVEVHTDDVTDLQRVATALGARLTIRKC